MSRIGQLEKKTQNRVVVLLRNELNYRTFGDWTLVSEANGTARGGADPAQARFVVRVELEASRAARQDQGFAGRLMALEPYAWIESPP